MRRYAEDVKAVQCASVLREAQALPFSAVLSIESSELRLKGRTCVIVDS